MSSLLLVCFLAVLLQIFFGFGILIAGFMVFCVQIMVGEKRESVELEERSELCHKRVKMRDLESVFRSEGIPNLFHFVVFHCLHLCID